MIAHDWWARIVSVFRRGVRVSTRSRRVYMDGRYLYTYQEGEYDP